MAAEVHLCGSLQDIRLGIDRKIWGAEGCTPVNFVPCGYHYLMSEEVGGAKGGNQQGRHSTRAKQLRDRADEAIAKKTQQRDYAKKQKEAGILGFDFKKG